jgi:hypothetical protein
MNDSCCMFGLCYTIAVVYGLSSWVILMIFSATKYVATARFSNVGLFNRNILAFLKYQRDE